MLSLFQSEKELAEFKTNNSGKIIEEQLLVGKRRNRCSAIGKN